MADKIATLKLYEVSTATTAGSVTTINLAAQEANVCVAAPTDPQQTVIRLYRRGGSLPESWFQTGNDYPVSSLSAGGCGAGHYQIVDNTPDDGLGNELQLDNDVPVTSVSGQTVPLAYIWGPFLGRVLGCGDPGRPDAVYWCKSGNADAWGSQQWLTVSNPSEPMMNGCVYNTRCFAFSTERLYELVSGISVETFTPFPTPCAHGLISPWGFCVYDAIYFVSKDGIYRTTGGEEVSLVENDIKPIFPTLDSPAQDVNGYEAVDMTALSSIRLCPFNNEIWFFYKGQTSGTPQLLIFDIMKKRWRAADYVPEIRLAYSEPSTVSSLLLSDDSVLYAPRDGDDDGTPIVVHVRTGAQDQGIPLNTKEYGNVLFDLNPGGADNSNPIVITPYINGEAFAEAAINVTGAGRQQVPLSLSDVIAYNIEFDISWNRTFSIDPILYQYDILWREEPVYTKHFEVRATSHGLPGWQYIKDMFVALRSTATVTLTLVFDENTTQTYSLPSTGGLRKKIYLPMDSNKFKMVGYSFDSTAQFKLYESDSEVRVRPWVNPLGYVIRKPFGADSVLTTAAFESRAIGGE